MKDSRVPNVAIVTFIYDFDFFSLYQVVQRLCYVAFRKKRKFYKRSDWFGIDCTGFYLISGLI